MADTCPHCETDKCAFSVYCLGCCVRLIMQAHPSRQAARGLLAAIDHYRGRHQGSTAVPSREAIVEAVRAAIAVRDTHNI